MRRNDCLLSLVLSALGLGICPAEAQNAAADAPQASYANPSHSSVVLEADGKRYLVDLSAGTVRAASPGDSQAASPGAPQATSPGAPAAAALFAQNCSTCHGPDGKGIASVGTPNFTDRSVQAVLSDSQIGDIIRHGKGRMPAWSGRLSDAQITELAAYIRSFAAAQGGAATAASARRAGVYQPGDDVLFTLPTGRLVDRHGLYLNFSHRFVYDPVFTGSRAQELFGLDNFALASFGLRYGVTDRLSVEVYRSPTFIGRPIQLLAAYNLLDENHGAPLNLAVRVSIEGQNNFRKNYTENLEAEVSRSVTSRAQLYFVPTMSFNDRRLVQPNGFRSSDIPDVPGINAFSLGIGAAVDIAPTVALIAEVIPTLANATDLGIHRPPFSFAIQKKIYRHAFTFGFSTSPGTTVSQRAGTRATYLGDPSADTPAGLFMGFDLTRQLR